MKKQSLSKKKKIASIEALGPRRLTKDKKKKRVNQKKKRKKNNLATTHPSVTGQTPKCAASGALDRRDWNHRRLTLSTRHL